MSKYSKEFKARLKPGYTAKCRKNGGGYFITVTFPDGKHHNIPGGRPDNSSTKPAAWEYALAHGEDVLEPEEVHAPAMYDKLKPSLPDPIPMRDLLKEALESVSTDLQYTIDQSYTLKLYDGDDDADGFAEFTADDEDHVIHQAIMYCNELEGAPDPPAAPAPPDELATVKGLANAVMAENESLQTELTELREQARVLAKAARYTYDECEIDDYLIDASGNGRAGLRNALAQPAIAALLEAHDD